MKKGKEPVIPEKYCLGKGHMSFFANKLEYLHNRQDEIIVECIKRNFKIKYIDGLKHAYHDKIPDEYWNDCLPDKDAMSLNMQRISERLQNNKQENKK